MTPHKTTHKNGEQIILPFLCRSRSAQSTNWQSGNLTKCTKCARLFFLPSENRTKNRRFCCCIRAGHDRISAKTAAVSIDAKVPPFTFRFPGASSLIRSLRSVMRLRRARSPQSYGKPHHCWAERRKPPESPLLKNTPKRRCYLI